MLAQLSTGKVLLQCALAGRAKACKVEACQVTHWWSQDLSLLPLQSTLDCPDLCQSSRNSRTLSSAMKNVAVIRSREVAVIRGYLTGDAIGTKVSGHCRQGGHTSGVAVKRGSTVGPFWHRHDTILDTTTSLTTMAYLHIVQVLFLREAVVCRLHSHPRKQTEWQVCVAMAERQSAKFNSTKCNFSKSAFVSRRESSK